MKIKKYLFHIQLQRIALCSFCSLVFNVTSSAQTAWSRAANNIEIEAEAGISFSDKGTPLWLSSNRYGLTGISDSWGYLKAGLERKEETDSAYRWRFGYGISLAASYDMTNTFTIQQLYGEVAWKALRLSVGSKERVPELKNPLLSSGGLTQSMNARPVPQIRFELPDFWTIPRTGGWLAIRGHLAYGKFTDGNWQEKFHAPNSNYSKGTLYHSKAGFLRIGNTQKFPLTFTGGLEMCAQFGGEAWNVGKRADDQSGFTGDYVKMSNGLKSFWNALIPGGSDQRDGDFKNVEGNHVGSWHFSLDYQGKGWGIRTYAEHFFEDHSQLFWEYGWKDLLWGMEVNLPPNPILSSFLYEHLGTMDQTGSIYHDGTPLLPDQISGMDNYYNHMIYGAWQHWGQVIGNPLLISPIYNKDHKITVRHSRIKAHHFGICGSPIPEINYRMLFTHVRSLGTYPQPLIDPAHANYFLFEVGYIPHWAKGFSVTASVGSNGGDILDKSVGGLLTLRWNGKIQ